MYIYIYANKRIMFYYMSATAGCCVAGAQLGAGIPGESTPMLELKKKIFTFTLSSINVCLGSNIT